MSTGGPFELVNVTSPAFFGKDFKLFCKDFKRDVSAAGGNLCNLKLVSPPRAAIIAMVIELLVFPVKVCERNPVRLARAE